MEGGFWRLEMNLHGNGILEMEQDNVLTEHTYIL